VNLAIISRNRESYSTRRLRAAAVRRGYRVRVADPLEFSVYVEAGRPSVHFRGLPWGSPDAIIPRIGASITPFGTALVRQFEQMGIFCLNSAHAITVSRDKLRAMQVLSRHDIGIPATAFVHHRADIGPAIEQVGGPPVIIKLLEGTQGVGVMLAENAKVAEAIVETLLATQQHVLIQAFVSESRGRDLRAFFVGGRIVAAMRRVAQGDEFRSNVHRGGRAERATLDPECERVALRSAELMGLHVAGVDMLEASSGPQVMEVNSSPGLEGIETATGVDVAGSIIRHLEEQMAFPEVDLKERLNIGSEYQIAEITVHDLPDLEGRMLQETDLGDRRVRVLWIRRSGVEIANPTGTTRVHPGDTLLCYGPRAALRSLLGPRRPTGARGGAAGETAATT
jgi:ribosomal protein S6--L-glutamate ligase